MERERFAHRRLRWLWPLFALAACGCQTVRTPEEQIAKSGMPIELNKMSLPEYVIEPPDLVLIEVLEALPGRPITGERLVRPDGTVSLDFYGNVYIAGLTPTEAKEKIVIHLRKFLTDETLGLILEDPDPDDPNKTKLSVVQPRDTDRVFVDVTAYNSKVYYIMGDVLAPGRLPITGNETVLDGINYAGGLAPTASVPNIRLVRPAPPGSSCDQVLPVNYEAIVHVGDPTTNYQLMPGDRIVVYRDPIVRATVLIDRLAAPFNAVVQSMLTYTFMVRNLKSINIPINGGLRATTTTSPGNVPPTTGPAR
jgi:polysaccharide export outer membrane protein